jgi:hypothetical protein
MSRQIFCGFSQPLQAVARIILEIGQKCSDVLSRSLSISFTPDTLIICIVGSVVE